MVLTSGGNLAIAATAKLTLDGVAATGDTYLVESAANTLDLVAGTSVGAIAALAMAFEVPLQRVVRLFQGRGSEVFSPRARPRGTVTRLLDLSRSVLGPKYTGAALREVLDVPVSAMTESGLACAGMLGTRLGLLTLGTRMLPLYRELVDGYGLSSRVVGWCTLEQPGAFGSGGAPDPQVADAVAAGIARLVAEDGVEAVLLSGAVLASLPVALAYLLFQRRVTQAIALSAGIKG
jgi:hypothetical protein